MSVGSPVISVALTAAPDKATTKNAESEGHMLFYLITTDMSRDGLLENNAVLGQLCDGPHGHGRAIASTYTLMASLAVRNPDGIHCPPHMHPAVDL